MASARHQLKDVCGRVQWEDLRGRLRVVRAMVRRRVSGAKTEVSFATSHRRLGGWVTGLEPVTAWKHYHSQGPWGRVAGRGQPIEDTLQECLDGVANWGISPSSFWNSALNKVPATPNITKKYIIRQGQLRV